MGELYFSRRELLSPPSVVGSIETQRFSKSPSIAEMGIKTIFNYTYITLLHSLLTSDLPHKTRIVVLHR